MAWYLVQPRDWVSIYGFLIFAKNIHKDIGENLTKNLSVKYIQRPLDHVKQSPEDALKTGSKRVIQKKKKHKQLMIYLVIKLLIKLQKSKKCC